jgi:hypothetical protein
VYYVDCPSCGAFKPERVVDGFIQPCGECRLKAIELRLDALERRK